MPSWKMEKTKCTQILKISKKIIFSYLLSLKFILKEMFSSTSHVNDRLLNYFHVFGVFFALIKANNKVVKKYFLSPLDILSGFSSALVEKEQ